MFRKPQHNPTVIKSQTIKPVVTLYNFGARVPVVTVRLNDQFMLLKDEIRQESFKHPLMGFKRKSGGNKSVGKGYFNCCIFLSNLITLRRTIFRGRSARQSDVNGLTAFCTRNSLPCLTVGSRTVIALIPRRSSLFHFPIALIRAKNVGFSLPMKFRAAMYTFCDFAQTHRLIITQVVDLANKRLEPYLMQETLF